MRKLIAIFSIALTSLWASKAYAYYANGRWVSTALGESGPMGKPVEVTWGFALDGTEIPGADANGLIGFLDAAFGDGGQPSLESRPWFQLFADAFGRWEALSGLMLIYEPNDDGAPLRGAAGELGVRADIRIGGTWIDGPSGTLASTGFIPDADVTLDIGDGAYYGNPLPAGLYQNIHNTLTHEIGHALGLGHVEAPQAVFLMEPLVNAAIFGPQLDDVRGIQHLYGDAFEKAFDGVGNDALTNAIDLGGLSPGGTLSVGDDAATGLFVLRDETDFVSLSSEQDVDVYAFGLEVPSFVTIDVAPLGGSYTERNATSNDFVVTNAGAVSDLRLELWSERAGTFTRVAAIDAEPKAQGETLFNVPLSLTGRYLMRVSGDADGAQLYSLSATARVIDGDFTLDGIVDGEDLLAWQRTAFFDADALLEVWQGGFGATLASSEIHVVPEPQGLLLGLLACGTTVSLRAVGRTRRSSVARGR
ncbi:MAG: matrixin family metalloprotease [Planctomycetales bacterium]|nr:matrixin family metalloprotease [Planctomycetales bacterium]